MLSLVLALAAAAAAAPNQLPLPKFDSFFNESYHTDALARFHASIGSQEELGKIQSALRALTDGLEPLPEVSTAVVAGPRSDDSAFRRPTIEEINRPIAAYLYGGDIMIDPSTVSERSKRGAPVISATKWSKTQPIAYIFNGDMDTATRAVIRNATSKIAENTCLSFQENGSGTQLIFHRGGGCWSYIGKMPWDKQPISIDNGCGIIAIVSHEVSHAIGIMHTQTRKDRDAYVTVNMAAISNNVAGNFLKVSDSENDNFGVPYEYGSVMHYGAYDFSNNGQPVLVSKESGFEKTMGQRLYETFNDYKLINLLYNCAASCCNQITCQNGGYQSPKNCQTCVCPEFYTGTNCQTPKNVINLSTNTPSKTNFSTPYVPETYNTNVYNWDAYSKDTIRTFIAPAGRKIKVTIDKLHAAYGGLACYSQCPYVAMEFVDAAGGDLSSVGKQFCCKRDEGTSFISKSNVIGYKAFSMPGMPFDAEVTYTVV